MKILKSIRNREKINVLLLSALVITLVMTLPRLVMILYVKFNNPEGTHRFQDAGDGFVLKLLFTYAVAVVCLFINTSRFRLIFKRARIDLNSFYQRVIINLVLYSVIRAATIGYNRDTSGFAVTEKFQDFLFSITLAFEIILCLLASEIYRLMIKNQEMRTRNQALEKANLESGFEVLKSQVNPHFLFNSLNTINAMIGSTNDAARAFVGNMSDVYRYVLNSVNKSLVTLAEELEVVQSYAAMLRQRHGEALQLEIHIEEQVNSLLIPPMSLQVLLENAVKHNIVSARQPLLVVVEAMDNLLTVSNPMQEKRVKAPGTGLGLYNLNQRYQYLCQKEIEISRRDGVFKVSIPLLGKKYSMSYERSYQTETCRK